MKIILDALSGDNAPLEIVKGGILAANEFNEHIILVGDINILQKTLKDLGEENNKNISLVSAQGVVTMEDDASCVLKAKRESSLGVSLSMLAKDEGDVLVSAGNTGAILTGATLIVKRIPGIKRAGLAPILPTKTGGAVLIDCGANVEVTPEYLVQFGIMGSVYSQNALNKQNPRVALVNNGAESTKGTKVLKETYKLLENAKHIINFTGNIEGRDIPNGIADVLVTDGFTGNVLLKTYEGVALYIASEVKKIFTKNIITKLASLLVSGGIDNFKRQMDYKEVGGAPLLGIKKPIIKAHGSSNAYAIRSAIKQAIDYKNGMVIEEIIKKIS